MNSTISLQLTTLTPVHIGTGRDFTPGIDILSFEGNEKQLALIDTARIMELIGEDQLDQWVNIIDQGREEGLREWLSRIISSPLSAAMISTRQLHVKDGWPGSNVVREQLHLANPQRPTVPGSALKGSVRTAIFNEQIQSLAHFTSNDRNLTDRGKRNGSRLKFNDRQLQGRIFGRKSEENRYRGGYDLDANRDFMRLLRFSDFYFPAITECRTLEIINSFRDGWGVKQQETSYLECIPAGQQSKGRFHFPAALLEQIKRPRFQNDKYRVDKLRRHRNYTQLDRLFECVNQLTHRLLKSEIEFWKEENNPTVIGDYMDHLSELAEYVASAQTDNACVLRIGAASGWDFMTGAWAKNEKLVSDKVWYDLRDTIQRREYPDSVPAPKTRKLIPGGLPLGFVELRKG